MESTKDQQIHQSPMKGGVSKIDELIEKIGQLSGEKKRRRINGNPEREYETSEEKSKVLEEEKSEEVTDQQGEITSDKKKRGGILYGQDSDQVWDVESYLVEKSSKIASTGQTFRELIEEIKGEDTDTVAIKEKILESALLPTIEAVLRSKSLLEMFNEYEKVSAILDLIAAIVKHKDLFPVLSDIGEEYEPRQSESIIQLIFQMEELCQVYANCLSTQNCLNSDSESSESLNSQNLAKHINDVAKLIRDCTEEQNKNAILQDSIKAILEQPLEKAYNQLLSSLRFEYMDMKMQGYYNHYHTTMIDSNKANQLGKIIRIAKEIADLSNALPCEADSAVFLRVDQSRVDVMKFLIMGSSGTPYAHGAFIYDLFMQDSYPNSPPQCQLWTTGGHQVRFNPNLYEDGKVCLSLLGTWDGQESENWQPNISTILQLILSIQSIIMSSDIHTNEPGYEYEMDTPEGDAKNEAYSNIVRYCNIKFAMIDAIINPPKGFEKVILRSFYLKKNLILQEVQEWIKRSRIHRANYGDLCSYHNSRWMAELQDSYPEKLEEIYKELQQTLESIAYPFNDEKVDSEMKDEEVKESEKEVEMQILTNSKQDESNIASVDMSYDGKYQYLAGKGIQVTDADVQDRWSRYIGAMGIESVAKQANARIVLVGLGPLGIEIAKNLVLSGCKELIIFDDKIPSVSDIGGGQFYLSEEEVKQGIEQNLTRAQISLPKLEQLNLYVKVTVKPRDALLNQYLAIEKDIKILILANDAISVGYEDVIRLNNICRAKDIGFIHSLQNGHFCRLFNDFHGLRMKEIDQFVVNDVDGEELQEIVVDEIKVDESGEALVSITQGMIHRLGDGDLVIFSGVKKGEEAKGWNEFYEKQFTVKVINRAQFSIGNVSEFQDFQKSSLIAKQVKRQNPILFKSYQQIFEDKSYAFDENLLLSDFEKINNSTYAEICYQHLLQTIDLANRQKVDVKTFFEGFPENIVTSNRDKEEMKDQIPKLLKFAQIFILTVNVQFPPLAAYLGGIVSQEAIKAITQKFMPINQMMCYDTTELYPYKLESQEEFKQLLIAEPVISREHNAEVCLGKENLNKLQEAKVFLIGVGAIGCELLKNYACLGIGTKGQIVMTDPDVIEQSNLNRQFLFREKHLRKPKSYTAAAAAIVINPSLQDHIIAKMDRVHEQTSRVYSENFFREQSIVTNALDNIQARIYIDSRCVSGRVPLVDSGTLGPKGHVQSIIPFKTESYASQNDPEENQQIPVCTLKMFPEETIHCVEWAKDLFGKIFTLECQNYNKVMFDDKEPNFENPQEMMQVKKALKTHSQLPPNIEAATYTARDIFEKLFNQNVQQLLEVYPEGMMSKDNTPFWSLPKRKPSPLVFSPDNEDHRMFIFSFASLLMRVHNQVMEPFNNEMKKQHAKQALTSYQVKPYIGNSKKAEGIKEKMENQDKKEAVIKKSTSEEERANIQKQYNEILLPIKQIMKDENKLQVQEFEKDNDSNFHVDIIHSLTNLRAECYGLEKMDRLTVKIKAGKIMPALSTTTSAIAALQTIEVIKVLIGKDISELRNSFVNIALPSVMLSEPGVVLKNKVKEGFEVSLWDRWEYHGISREHSLIGIIQDIEQKHSIVCKDVFHGSAPVFISAIQGNTESEKKEFLGRKIKEIIHSVKDESEFIDLTVTFVDGEEMRMNDAILKYTPSLRIYFSE